jgi:hypothetical protein
MANRKVCYESAGIIMFYESLADFESDRPSEVYVIVDRKTGLVRRLEEKYGNIVVLNKRDADSSYNALKVKMWCKEAPIHITPFT